MSITQHPGMTAAEDSAADWLLHVDTNMKLSDLSKKIAKAAILKLVDNDLEAEFTPEMQDRVKPMLQAERARPAEVVDNSPDADGIPYGSGEKVVHEPEEKVERTIIHNEQASFPAPPADAVYHGLVGDWVRAVAPETEASPIALLTTFLTIFGTLVGGGPWLDQGGPQSAVLFSVVVGDTGSARKGTGLVVTSEVFTQAYASWRDITLNGLGSGEALITELKQRKEDPRALILETELARLLTAMAREGSTISTMLRNAWDGVSIGRYVADPNKSGQVHDHHIGILGHITALDLAQKLTTSDAANGFGNRFLWVASQRSQVLPNPKSVAELSQPFVKRLFSAIEFGRDADEVRWGKDAKPIWAKFYMDRQMTPRAGFLADMTYRGETYVARLAMVYALLDEATYIEPQHLKAAMALWDYCERSARYIFGDSTGNRQADALLAWMDPVLRPEAKWDEAKKYLNVRTAEEMEAIITHLQKLDRVYVEKEQRAGRPTRWIVLTKPAEVVDDE